MSSEIDQHQLKLSSFDILDEIGERSGCERCRGVSRRYFCYTCCTPVPALIDRLPRVRLPIEIDIVRHPKEKHGKSTGVQAAILAPDQVRLFMYPDFPDYRNEKAILVFPDQSTMTLSQLINTSTTTDPPQSSDESPESSSDHRLAEFRRLIREATRFVLIDCTWFQVGGMRKHAHFRGIPTVALDGRRTRYWRPQHNCPDENLATIEAVYYLCRDYDEWKTMDDEWKREESSTTMDDGSRKRIKIDCESITDGDDQKKTTYEYDGKYDDLLYFFEYFRAKVENEQKLREAQKRNRIDDDK